MHKFYRLVLCMALMQSVSMATYAEPHPHQGILPPFTQPTETFTLTDKEHAKLAKLKPVYLKALIDGKQRGLAIFYIDAPVDVIWSTIRQFKHYPQWIDEITSTDVYEQTQDRIFVHYIAHHWLLGKTEWYVKHDYPPMDQLDQQNWGTWQLDYRHASDFDDSVGFWVVKPIEGSPNRSQVIYAVDLKMKQGTPNFIQNKAIKEGLKSATKWLKREAEASFTATSSTEFSEGKTANLQ